MSVEETLRDFWKTRPQRPRKSRKVAGVAAAFGNRYGIDPVLVRVAFVVLAVYGGLGFLLYLLGILFLPQEGDTSSPAGALMGRGSSSTSALATVVLALMALPLSAMLMALHVWSVMMIAALGAGLYVLHRNRGSQRQSSPNGPVVVSPPVTTTSSGGFQSSEFRTETLHTPGQQESETTTDQGQAGPTATGHGPEKPPAWDPLGAAPFAWDLPEPSPPASDEVERPAQPRSRVTTVTAAVSFIVAGVMGLGVINGWVADHVAAGAVTAVIAAGLLVGAFRQGGKGLVLLAIPAIVGTVTLANDASWRDYAQRFQNVDSGYYDSSTYYGTQTWTPRSWEELQRGSEIGGSSDASFFLRQGTGRLDLSQLPPPPNDQPVPIHATVDQGDLQVILPNNDVDAEISCSARSGSVTCLDQVGQGWEVKRTARSYGADDAPGGGQITLYASVRNGRVEVSR